MGRNLGRWEVNRKAVGMLILLSCSPAMLLTTYLFILGLSCRQLAVFGNLQHHDETSPCQIQLAFPRVFQHIDTKFSKMA